MRNTRSGTERPRAALLHPCIVNIILVRRLARSLLYLDKKRSIVETYVKYLPLKYSINLIFLL